MTGEDVKNELRAAGWVHCKCKPPRNWAHPDLEFATCWPIDWAIEWEAERARIAELPA